MCDECGKVHCFWCRMAIDPEKAVWEDGHPYCDVICADSDHLDDEKEDL